MLEAVFTHAGLEGSIERILSVEAVGVFKPHPDIYRLAVDSFEVPADQILFMSSNTWDAFAVSAFGLTVAWVNRFGQSPERLPSRPDAEITSLSELLVLLGIVSE